MPSRQVHHRREKKQVLKFTINCTAPAKLIDIDQLRKFLVDRIKVNGKAGQLGNKVSVSRDKTNIYVSAVAPFSKSYLKYLTKKYLKKENLRDFLRVVATNKATYELRFFNIGDNEDEDDE
mmetsp:Transcript_35369/g.88923  ORF Transcript_35369/g.88923 Transcript_35369/m.88923 type:complete len:121 (-) Transcript_35369:37-399(-)|eukprot:CAMPEP_0177653678 /NCGR_PEP_ID=MMETSP0447-20121125/13878_1 /TAXON_ID=0 /ORGANISM="Stygamoeba regulata, Strain BSH-02190019" /LENGTH=120 /DNA_ID=CAMNT_0019157179 /DNA_START=76 /DNA_END=438 /DNA_ORIENTATION=+